MKKVSAAVVINEGNVLITRRKPEEKLAGFWEFPGGKIEEGETPQQCLERELREELGIESTAGKVICESIYKYEHGKFKIIAMITELHSREFVLKSHDQAEWIPFERLLDYKLLPADIPIAEKIIMIPWIERTKKVEA